MTRRPGGTTPGETATRWRLLHDGAADGATNMAADAALLASVQDGADPVLRLYRWDRPTLSFGRNQTAAGLYDEAAAVRRGIAFVRRPTGGQAVLHADELTYAVVAAVDAVGKPRTAYRRINAALVAGLRRLGVEAEVAGVAATATGDAGSGRGMGTARSGVGLSGTGTHAHRHTHTTLPAGSVDWTRACFREPAEGEVVVRGRKLVGSAQRYEGGVILQHGSILISGSQAAAEELLVGGGTPRAGAAGSHGWTTLSAELGGRPDVRELTEAVAAGFEETLGTALAPGRLSVEDTACVSDQRVRFASPEWTWRR